MRSALALALLPILAGGCAPEIPVKADFGTSALRPTGNIPSEFAAFNNFDGAVNPLLLGQMCATPYILQIEATAPAVPGELVAARGQCQTYAASLGQLEHLQSGP
jgi:hypothetical protein